MRVSIRVAVARALKTAQMAITARSIAQRYLRRSVSMLLPEPGYKSNAGATGAEHEIPNVLKA